MRFPQPSIVSLIVALCSFITVGLLRATHRSDPMQSRDSANDNIRRPGVSARLIPVDVIVTDDQHPVTDLKEEEFQIFENGSPQQIRHFSLQTRAAAEPDPAQMSVLRAVPVLELQPQPYRIFLILLGQGRHQDRYRAIDALIHFVKTDLLPQDRVAVYAYNRATDFTSDHEQIAAVLERYKKKSDKLESWLESGVLRVNVVYGAKEVPEAYQSEIGDIFYSGAGPARKVPPGLIAQQSTMETEWDRIAEAIVRPFYWTGDKRDPFDDLEARAAGLWLPFGEFARRAATSIQDMQNIFTCVEYLRYMEGEKHLLFFTGRGLLAPNGHIDVDRGVAAVANDARVAIDSFHTWCLVPLSYVGEDKGPQPSPLLTADPRPAATVNAFWSDKQVEVMQAGLVNISQLTGGHAAIDGDIGKALDLVDGTTRVEYLLGYYPKDMKFDGGYRKISVRVNRPGLKLSFRQGYYARDQLFPYEHAESLAYSRISSAGGYLSADMTDVGFKIRTAGMNHAGNQDSINIELTIDAEKVAFRTENNLHFGRLRIALFLMDASGRYVGNDWETLDLQLQPGTYRRYLKSGIPFSVSIPFLSRGQNLKVVIYDMVGDKVGCKQIRI
ncbi:MAG: VWA domain-containing protein [Acidobacteriota bacterium]